ncbi:M42 family metallopeptidase [Fusibacter tunisiensis]|uniref:Aminopeptidase FrvX n=1 Tax=Fusibacter tunisiensis TaxID=1008308 RepID=A0ABS2MMQ1_9FIRM|nr:M20/M25/M40 family metallo-hydrolase [Fusibacter tunisiensis]MBM7560679.1 putative aminopeptidase FrvX [Fusibacter tunisiensis]
MRLKMIEDLSKAFGPSGFEEDVVQVVQKYGSKFNIEADAMNNVYLSLKSNTGEKPILMLDAHIDEVGFMVQSIKKNGLISFVPLGGWVPTNIPAHTVQIKTQAGNFVKGIVGSKPPHFMSEKEKSAPLLTETLLIDVGCTSRDEVVSLLGIQVGDPIAPSVEFNYNEKTGIMFGKAFDNRLGTAAVIETLEKLSEIEDLPFDVIGALASQEEVGTRGAYVTSQVVKPDIAIVFEGSPADDLYVDAYSAQCVLKKGAQIRHMDASYVSHRGLINTVKALAHTVGIPVQSAVRLKGGTNAGRIHIQNKAVPVLVLGIPSRYVHTHYNYAAFSDFEAVVDLAKLVATQLDMAQFKPKAL